MSKEKKGPQNPQGPIKPTPAPKVPLLLRRAAASGALALSLGLAPACGDDTAPMEPPMPNPDSGGGDAATDAAMDSTIAPMPPPMPAPDSSVGDAGSDADSDSSAADAATDTGVPDAVAPMPPPMPAPDGG